ncbi:MAG: hypothetical protein ACXWLX_04580 [Rhizomicrobium sp.]
MPVVDAMMVMNRPVVMVPGGGAGGGRAQYGKGDQGSDKGFHCDLQNG